MTTKPESPTKAVHPYRVVELTEQLEYRCISEHESEDDAKRAAAVATLSGRMVDISDNLDGHDRLLHTRRSVRENAEIWVHGC